MNEEALYERIAQLEAENLELKKQLLAMQKKVIELERRLLAYENAHTPPSLSKKKREPKEPRGKLGALEGHPKWQREQPEPTRTVEHTLDACPHCNHKLKKPFKIERRVIEEIPKPQPIIVTEHLISHYECPHCHKRVKTKTGLPKGMFGPNAETLTVLLHFEDRLPLRKTVTALQRQGLNMTNVCVHNISKRTALTLTPEYQKQILLLRASKVVYADETEIKINGKVHWLWTFVGEQQTIYVIRKQRNESVATEILGNEFAGITTSDGHTAYRKIGSAQQRCWAHIIRESKELNNNYPLYKCHHNNLNNIFKTIKCIRAKPPPLQKRLELKKQLEKRTTQIADALDSHREYHTFAVKLRNAIPSLFTCIIHLFVEPTNNIAERALRELIVIRKIIGGLRRENGARTMETIASMLATWKQQGKSLYPTLKKAISG
jgi:transposase